MTNDQDAVELRPLLFSIAYQMLGILADAEDVVLAAYLRYLDHRKRGREVDSTRALLTAITTRLAIDPLRSARTQRETYIGPWLPEPLLTSNQPDVAEAAAMSDPCIPILILLEALSPVERAVFLLREVFAYDYDDIARIVDMGEATSPLLPAPRTPAGIRRRSATRSRCHPVLRPSAAPWPVVNRLRR